MANVCAMNAHRGRGNGPDVESDFSRAGEASSMARRQTDPGNPDVVSYLWLMSSAPARLSRFTEVWYVLCSQPQCFATCSACARARLPSPSVLVSMSLSVWMPPPTTPRR